MMLMPAHVRQALAFVLLSVLAIVAVWCLIGKYDAQVIDRYEQGVQVEIGQQAREAEAKAAEAVHHTQRKVEASNDAARQAAAAGNDPLADALRQLRADTSGAPFPTASQPDRLR